MMPNRNFVCVMTQAFITTLALLVARSSLIEPVFAGDNSPVGEWRTIDDTTGTPRSIVEVSLVDGRLEGKVVKIFLRPGDTPFCDKCDGTRKGQRVLGMTILWDLKPSGGKWTDGSILDPDTGNIYSANLRLEDGGKRLHVRGYIGLSIIGRSQDWLREN
jgi:uncharacterized protein (DUF2147 family)